jgi:hypothetical protein
MKTKSIFRILLFATIAFASYNCSKEDESIGDGDSQLNKIVGTINGKDTVMNIQHVEITTFNRRLKSQTLTVISEVPANGGLQIDFYANDTTAMKVNTKHYMVDPFSPGSSLGVCTGYIHKYASGGGISQMLYATVSDEDNYCMITKLDNNIIQGEVKYKVHGITFSGKFYSDKLEYKTSAN